MGGTLGPSGRLWPDQNQWNKPIGTTWLRTIVYNALIIVESRPRPPSGRHRGQIGLIFGLNVILCGQPKLNLVRAFSARQQAEDQGCYPVRPDFIELEKLISLSCLCKTFFLLKNSRFENCLWSLFACCCIICIVLMCMQHSSVQTFENLRRLKWIFSWQVLTSESKLQRAKLLGALAVLEHCTALIDRGFIFCAVTFFTFCTLPTSHNESANSSPCALFPKRADTLKDSTSNG